MFALGYHFITNNTLFTILFNAAVNKPGFYRIDSRFLACSGEL